MAGELKNGTIIDDRYEIVGFLGHGGFANVYRAKHRHMDREVAIKVLSVHTHNADGGEVVAKRFLAEASAAAKIEHSNVVQVYDFGFTGEQRQPYIAMQLLSGHDLEHELDGNGPLEPRRLWPLFLAALDALAEAHRLGIVHKDLKPANLFLVHPRTPRESIRVVDFGVARQLTEEETKLTKSGQIFGTPAYLAPEYIMSQTVTPGCDVYQMGLILIELLSGQTVVRGDNAWALCAAHIHGTIPVPQALVASPLGPVLARALAVDPDQRYRDAAVLREALARVDPLTVPWGAELAEAPKAADGWSSQFGLRHTVDAAAAPTAMLDRAHEDAHLGQSGRLGQSGPMSLAGTEPARRSTLLIAGLSAFLAAGLVVLVLLLTGAFDGATSTPPAAATPSTTQARDEPTPEAPPPPDPTEATTAPAPAVPEPAPAAPEPALEAAPEPEALGEVAAPPAEPPTDAAPVADPAPEATVDTASTASPASSDAASEAAAASARRRERKSKREAAKAQADAPAETNDDTATKPPADEPAAQGGFLIGD